MKLPEIRRRGRSNQEHMPSDGLYVHSNPPRVLQLNSAYVKQLIRGGDIEKLKNLVIEGEGKRLIGGYSADYKVRTFLKSVPNMMMKIRLLHDAVNSDRLEELQALLEDDPDRQKLILAKDDAGVSLLHKSVYYNLTNITKWIVQHFPHATTMRDSKGRTPYHYTALCRDPVEMQKLLISAGSDPSALDTKLHSAKFYMDHVSDLELPCSHVKSLASSKKSASAKEGVIIKKSNIRIWIHQRDLSHLQQVVWEGHGSKLLVEHSNNPKVKKFLEAVPHIMGLIRDIHTNVQNDDLDVLKTHTSPPIPPLVLLGKDSNGLTPLHKAAGLGRQEIAEYITEQCPESINSIDMEGRTPLHFAAIAKDDGKLFDFLVGAGADESVLDNKLKTPGYYKGKSSEIDQKLLMVVPESPRSAKENFGSTWDWSLLTSAPLAVIPKATKTIDQEPNDVQPEIQEPEEEKHDLHEAEPVENGKEKEEEPEEHEEDHDSAEQPTEGNGVQEEDEIKEDEVKKETEAKDTEAVENGKEEESTEAKQGEGDKDELGHNGEEHIEEPQKEEEEEEEKKVPEEKEEEPKEEKQEFEETPTDHSNDAEQKPIEAEDDGEGVIEGIVNGENEIESVNEQGQGVENDDKSDPEILTLIEEGNMEQLAALVLNGDGDKLIGQHSENPELQAFLDNVSTYMTKINRIHVAARDGSLRDLQAALDRRKFAIAKDHISPNEASPLHVATVFGNTSIVRYLAGRFPETVQTVDVNGRTPLHYAAVLADNGHYFNLLVHLGADIRADDKFGHTPDYYRTNQDDFSHRILLRDYGAEEVIDDLLNDKVLDDTVSARKYLDDPDMIAVLERCFLLLHGRRNSNAISATSHLTTSSDLSNVSVSSKHLRRYVFDAVKLRLTRLDHNLYDVIWPSVKKLPPERSFRIALEQDFSLGLTVPDFYSFRVFGEYLEPIIKEANSICLHTELREQPEKKFFADSEADRQGEFDFDLDPYGKWIITGTLECTRNLDNYELPKSLNIDELEEVERIVTSALLKPKTAKALNPDISETEISEKGSGCYYTMNEVLEDPSEIRVMLAANGLLIPLWNIPDSDRLHGKHWPYGRGVFVSDSGNLAAWINVLDHLRIVTCTSANKPANIGCIYSRISRLLEVLDEQMNFRKDEKLGYLSARPTSLGNTLRFSLTVRFPHLIKEQDNLKHLCLTRNLTYNKCDTSTDAVRIGNQQCLGQTELQTFEDFTTAVTNILQLEKDLAMSNSLHIAALFVNMFKRKRAGLVESH